MDRVDALLGEYRRQLSLHWRPDLSGAERTWMAVYPPELERRVRARLGDFELATLEAGHRWTAHDVTSAFSTWLAGLEDRDAYYEEPESLGSALSQFLAEVESQIGSTLAGVEAGPTSVVVLVGVGSLFPMIHVSELLQRIADRISGRLLILFPGSLERGNYRLLDARDGWNYLAIPITIPEGKSQ